MQAARTQSLAPLGASHLSTPTPEPDPELWSSVDVVAGLSKLEHQVIKFIKNAQTTVGILGDLPASSSDADTSERLEELVQKQKDILSVRFFVLHRNFV